MQRTGSIGKIWHRRKHSVEIDANILQDEFNQDAAASIEDANFQQVSDSTSSPSASLQVQNAAHVQHITREERASICIQTAFRGFLVL